MTSWTDFKATLTCLQKPAGEEGDTPFTRALKAIAASPDTNTYASFEHEETRTLNQVALQFKDGLQYIDVDIKRIADVVEQLFVTGASQVSLILGTQEEPLDHLPGTINVHFSRTGVTLLRAAQQYQPVQVRFYFDPQTVSQDHKFTLNYTGLVLHQVQRKLLITQPWVTSTHKYQNGVAISFQQ